MSDTGQSVDEARRVGRVLAIALRSARRGPMREVDRADARLGAGLGGDVLAAAERGITFLAKGQWAQVTSQLGVELPWHTRRANVLVDCPSLAHLMGCDVELGGVRVHIIAETRPCELMDELHPGLRAVLEPECRAGLAHFCQTLGWIYS